MKASELITALQAMIEEYGDVPVYCTDEFDSEGKFNEFKSEVSEVDFCVRDDQPEGHIHIAGPTPPPRLNRYR